MWLLPSSAGVFLLGPTWDSARQILPYITAEFVGLSIWTGAISLLRGTGRTRDSAVLRTVYLVAAVVATGAAAVVLGTARGVQAALAIIAGVIALVSWVRAARVSDARPVGADEAGAVV
jgi:hypothetical protein